MFRYGASVRPLRRRRDAWTGLTQCETGTCVSGSDAFAAYTAGSGYGYGDDDGAYGKYGGGGDGGSYGAWYEYGRVGVYGGERNEAQIMEFFETYSQCLPSRKRCA